MRPVIRLEHLTKYFRRQAALKDVSLDVPPGVVFALLGENGAGKTTAIRVMLGLASPSSGRAEVLGMDSRVDGQAIRHRVGYVPEQPTLYDWMTVDEIGWFSAGFYGNGFLPSYRRLTEQFELPARGKLKHLSKGMRAKVALALATAHEPQLLLLDEPTSGLDAMVRREFLESMIEVAAAGRTVLLSSHQINEVERVADVVAILREGELVLVERLDELKDDVRELTITLTDGAAGAPPLPGTVLTRRNKQRQWQVLVRGAPEGQLDALRNQQSVRDVEQRRPSLEEIFVAYMRPELAAGDQAVQGMKTGQA